MKTVRIIGLVLRVVLRIILFPARVLLKLLSMGLGFAGTVIGILGGIVGFIFIAGALIGAPMGIVDTKDFLGMMLCGICFGILPTAAALGGQYGIGKLERLLARV